jgi:hypothetical protein
MPRESPLVNPQQPRPTIGHSKPNGPPAHHRASATILKMSVSDRGTLRGLTQLRIAAHCETVSA